MGNPYRHPISTPVPELQGIASIAAPPMTDDLVGRLRALREAANPGTWMQLVADNAELLAQMEEDAGKVEDRVAGLIFTREGGAHGKGVTLATINARRSTIERDQANAVLIVEAVNGLPALIARIEALEAENRKLRSTLEFMRDTPNVAYRLTAKEALGEPLSWEERNGWDERG